MFVKLNKESIKISEIRVTDDHLSARIVENYIHCEVVFEISWRKFTRNLDSAEKISDLAERNDESRMEKWTMRVHGRSMIIEQLSIHFGERVEVDL